MDEETGGCHEVSVNGIHMLRTTQQIQMSLSQLADQKASILMGATFVVFTITMAQVKSATEPLPLVILGVAAFLAAVCTVLAILPATGKSKGGGMNLLFFGTFSQLDEEEYIRRLIAELATDERIYRAMARDLYQNGRVLQRKKYRLLGFAYRIFLVGLTLSFLAFVVQMTLLRS